jgi:hypothetical protein
MKAVLEPETWSRVRLTTLQIKPETKTEINLSTCCVRAFMPQLTGLLSRTLISEG